MTGASADVREADRLEDLADGSLVVCDAEAVRDDLPQVEAPPPDDAVDPAIGAGLDDLGEFGQLRLRQPGRVALGADVAQPVGAERVEAVNPIAQGLTIRAASARSIPSRTAASDSSRRLWLACFEAAASRRKSEAE